MEAENLQGALLIPRWEDAASVEELGARPNVKISSTQAEVPETMLVRDAQ